MRIAQRLRGHPILAIRAVQIASQHAEAVRQRAGISMEERFLFDGIALDAADVSPRHVQLSTLVEADFADASLSLGNWTAMPAGEAADAIALDGFVENAFPDVLIQDFAKRGQRGTSASILERRGGECCWSVYETRAVRWSGLAV